MSRAGGLCCFIAWMVKDIGVGYIIYGGSQWLFALHGGNLKWKIGLLVL